MDGRLYDAVWSRASLVHGFAQFRPVEGAVSFQRTKVLVLVDAEMSSPRPMDSPSS